MAQKSRKSSTQGGPSTTRRVTLVAPIAKEAARVVVTGDFSNWSPDGIPMRRRDDGVWSVTISLDPGEHQYRLIVDGEWGNNPVAERRTPNGFGAENDVLVVG